MSHMYRVFIRANKIGVCVALTIGTLGCGSGAPDIPEPPMGEMPRNENPQEKESGKVERSQPSGPSSTPSIPTDGPERK
jgi:hypothetical protein